MADRRPILLLCSTQTESALYARMIVLSLRAVGETVQPLLSQSLPQTLPEEALCIMDADVLSPEEQSIWIQRYPCIAYSIRESACPVTDNPRFLHRPFSVSKLLSLVRTLQGTAPTVPVPETSAPALPADALRFTEEGVFFRDTLLNLTTREFELLSYLYHHRGQVCSRCELLRAVWGYETDDPKTNVVDVYIRYLRAKIDHPFDVRLLCSVRHGGYLIR